MPQESAPALFYICLPRSNVLTNEYIYCSQRSFYNSTLLYPNGTTKRLIQNIVPQSQVIEPFIYNLQHIQNIKKQCVNCCGICIRMANRQRMGKALPSTKAKKATATTTRPNFSQSLHLSLLPSPSSPLILPQIPNEQEWHLRSFTYKIRLLIFSKWKLSLLYLLLLRYSIIVL